MAAVEKVDLSNGGTAIVVLGTETQIPSDFEMDPRIIPFTHNQLSGDEFFIQSRIPSQVRVVIVSEVLPPRTYETLRKVLEKRGIPYLYRKGQGSLDACLIEMFPRKSTVEPVNGNGTKSDGKKVIAPKGSIRDLVEQADLRKGSAEEARRLMRIAQEKGIPTTLGSLSQAIANRKRKMGAGEMPKSALKPQQQALRVLDEAIESLALIREYVMNTEQENDDLKAKLRKVEDIFGRRTN